MKRPSTNYREQLVRPLALKTLQTVARQVVAEQFDFTAGSYPVELIVNQVLRTLDDHDQAQHIRRVRPHELVVEYGEQRFTVPLLDAEILERVRRGESFVKVRRDTQEALYRQLLTVDQAVSWSDVCRLIAPWDLEPSRHRRRGGEDGADEPWIPTEQAFDFERLKSLIRAPVTTEPVPDDSPDPPRAVVDRLVPVIREEGRSKAAAELLVRTVAGLRDRFAPPIGELQSGEIIVVATDVTDRQVRNPTERRRMVPVRLQLVLPQEVQLLRREDSAPPHLIDAVLRDRAARIIVQAYAQGGLLPGSQTAFLLQVSHATASRLIAEYEQQHQIILPTPGAIHDVGSKFTHKARITDLHLQGYDAKEISHRTLHTIEAVNNYLRAFEAILLLVAHDLPSPLIPRIVGIGPSVVHQYTLLIEKHIGDRDAVRDYLDRSPHAIMQQESSS